MTTPCSRTPLALALLSATLFGQAALAQGCNDPPPYDDGIPPLSGNQAAQYIVKFRGESGAKSPGLQQRQSFETAALTPGAKARWLRRTAGGAEVMRIDGSSKKAIEQAARRLAQRADVEYVVEDRIFRPTLVTNDLNIHPLWGLANSPYGISAPQAWDSTRGAGAVIAVLDTGVTSHPDLQGNLLPGYDFISATLGRGDGNGRDPDASDPGDGYQFQCTFRQSSWHGTHVAGTAAAVGNNGIGVVGVAYQAKVLPVRVLGEDGGTLADIADAIIWAAGGSVPGVPANPHPAEVINLSLGASGPCGPVEGNAINFALSQGVSVVVSAGNDAQDAANATPASCPGVITVAASNSAGGRASFSNHGATVEIAAPGVDVWSTFNSGIVELGSPNYAPGSGTSMSAPHVAGVVALMQSVSPRTPAQVLQILQQTAKPAPGCAGCGAGIVNAAGAVAALGQAAPPVASFSESTPGGSGCPSKYTYLLASTSTDPNNDIVSLQWDLGGTPASGASTSLTLLAGATRYVTLTATDATGLSNSTSRLIGYDCLY